MTVCLVIFLPKMPYTHRIYMVLADPTNIRSYTVHIHMYGSGQPYKYTVIHGVYIWFWPTLQMYGHTRCIYMVMANPTRYVRSYTVYLYMVLANPTNIRSYTVYINMVLANPARYVRSYTVYIYGSGQPYTLCTRHGPKLRLHREMAVDCL